MRKNKFKNYLKLGILLFGVSIFLVNCQKDDDFTQTTKQELLTKSKIPFEFKKKSYAQLNNDVKFVKAINNVFNKGKTNSRVNAKTVMEDQYGFTIDSTLIKEISSDDFTSYTFLIHREVVNESVFENLVVTINNDSVPKAYIIKYHLNSNPIYISEDDAYAIDSQTELTEIDYNNSQLKVSYTDSDGCTIVTIMCPYGGSHPAGQACFNEDRGDLYFDYDSSNCGDSSGGGGGGGGFGNGGTSSGGGGGSGGSSGSSGDNGGLGTSCRGCGDTGGPILTDPIWMEEVEDNECSSNITSELENIINLLNQPLLTLEINSFLEQNNSSCDAYQTAVLFAQSKLESEDFEDYADGPSCESFNFQTTTTNGLWQNSAVKNIRFRVVVLSPQGNYVNFDIRYSQPILFGVPTNMINGGDISSGLAAELSAQALSITMSEVVNTYGNQPVSELQVRLYFEQRLKYNYPIITNGGRVTLNPMTLPVVPTEYQTNFFGNGNCD